MPLGSQDGSSASGELFAHVHQGLSVAGVVADVVVAEWRELLIWEGLADSLNFREVGSLLS